MPKFVVRVTIHDGREQDYQRLHKRWKPSAVFAGSCLVMVDGTSYQTPHTSTGHLRQPTWDRYAIEWLRL